MAGRSIFNLPNGLQGYYLVNASGFRLDEAPINIVSNPAASDPTVRNGLSCIGCHTEGMKTLEDQVRSVIESNTNPPYDKAQALRLYVEKSDMDARVGDDMERYRGALEATGGVLGGVEPISRFHEAFQGPVDAAYAAAVVGLETSTFLEKVRENTGLQNVGLLALEGENGSVQRDTWTASFRDVISALDYPGQVGEPPVITQPDVLPGGHVHFPDPNLRAAVAEALGTSPNAPITAEDMIRLTFLSKIEGQGIRDLTGLQFATNLSSIRIEGSKVSDLAPIAGLTQLKIIDIDFTDPPSIIHDAKQLSRLVNLTFLALHGVEDLTPLAGLPKLEELFVSHSNIRDLSPLAGLINLELIHMSGALISDLSPLAGLTKLEHVYLPGGDIADLTPLAGLTQLEELYLHHNSISDISPIAGLTNLKRLDLSRIDILSDISPLATLSNLELLSLPNNNISDISALARLTNLTWLNVSQNEISDLSPLDGLRPNLDFLSVSDNPYFPPGGPKILGPWLWLLLPGAKLPSGKDLLSEASGGTVTELTVATHGATAGQAIGGDSIWTLDTLPHQRPQNITDMLKDSIRDGTIYGSLSLYSPREQATMIYVGSEDSVKVWLNGVLVHQIIDWRSPDDYTDAVPVTLKPGRNVLLVAVAILGENGHGFFGFAPDADYTVGTGLGYGFSQTPIHVGDTFTLDIRSENVSNLAGWQFDIAFDPAILEAVGVSEGDFLKSDGGTTFFQSGRIDNAAGKITGLIAGRISEGGVSGTGSVLQVRFKAKSEGETELALQNFLFGSASKESIPAGPLEIHVTVKEQLLTGDVNRDGVVNILDLISVAQQLGKRLRPNSPEDINGDGTVNIFDLTLVAQGIGGAAAPGAATGRVDAATIQAWIAQARLANDGSIAFRQGIANLEQMLASLIIPQETALLVNYPNPFNPETWIPYQLASPAEVTLTIYELNGGEVRRLEMGHQAAGMYQNRNRALYWDGRNGRGESVASGLYFYTLKAGEFTATRKMLIRK